jgi:HlyD family secretion protein
VESITALYGQQKPKTVGKWQVLLAIAEILNLSGRKMMALKNSEQTLIKSTTIWSGLLGVAGILLGLGIANFAQQQPTPQQPAIRAVQKSISVVKVAALGRIEPEGEVIHLTFPNSLDGTRVGQVLVREGDHVHTGQVIAVLNTTDRRQAAVEEAKANVQVARAQRAKVLAGAKSGDLQAQQASIARLQAELKNSRLEYDRAESLFAQGALSASARDSKLLALQSVEEQINQARGSLGSIAEVRPVDVQVAEAQIANAMAAVKTAEQELELTYIRAPRDAQILKVHARPGEVPTNKGIADLGDTRTMYVVAEVYETDVEKVHIGQSATITSEALSGQLSGKVSRIGMQVDRQQIFDINPRSDMDRKVIEVRVRLDPASSNRVTGLTNLQVQTLIHL